LKRWFVFGDSHIGTIGWASDNGLLKRPCEFLEVRGATAVGLRNPHSTTNALAVYAGRLLPTLPSVVPVMHVGEVDCGFVIWWRAERFGESINSQLAESVDAAMAFADRLRSGGYSNVVVTGASVPTILDAQDWGDVTNLRREVKATLRERTDLTVEYNRRLHVCATDRGMPFIDIAPIVIDPATSVVAEYYRNPNPVDHHLHPERGGMAWAKALNALNPDVL
jgi:hypothetical protein